MWRSIARARRGARHEGPILSKLPGQVLNNHQNPKIFIQSHFSACQVLLFPGFFSTNTNNNVVDIEESPQSISEKHSFDQISSISSSEYHQLPIPIPIPIPIHASLIFDDETSNTHTQIVTDFDNDDQSVEEDDKNEIFEIDSDQLESVLSLLQSSTSLDGSLESTLDNMGLTLLLQLHQEFLVRVLETPLVPGENLIRFFKWCWSKPEISTVTTRAVYALARAICSGLRKKESYALWDLVKEVGEKENGVLNTEILNELISVFSRLGKGKAGFEVFNKFGEFGCVPDAETYYFTIEALCRRSIYDWACSVCENMINTGNLPDSEKIGAIISYLCNGSKAKDAHLVYLSAKEKERYPPRNSVNFLICSLCREDETVRLALEMLDDYSEGDERKRAINPFSSVIRGLCRIKDMEGAKELLFKMIDAGPPPGNAVFNSIINGFSKAGDMEEAKKVMKMMERRGLKPDVYTYSVIMSGYARGGEMEAACEVLAEAKKKHSRLSPVTYHTLIRGYCKLEEFDKALKLLSEMKEFGVQPTTDEYNKLIQSLCVKALDWETAEKLMEEMKDNGLHLNGITKGLIKAVKEMEEEEGKSGEAIVEAELLTSAN